jgi:hypothetical protein
VLVIEPAQPWELVVAAQFGIGPFREITEEAGVRGPRGDLAFIKCMSSNIGRVSSRADGQPAVEVSGDRTD